MPESQFLKNRSLGVHFGWILSIIGQLYFRHQGRDTEIAQNLRLSKPTDMTIHWKALEEHIRMVPH
jgi:hypothetical protein